MLLSSLFLIIPVGGAKTPGFTFMGTQIEQHFKLVLFVFKIAL